jgi:asparagine synthase (glutamine-hydrolysing)
MCGIAGSVTTPDHPHQSDIFFFANQILAHRGPDDYGFAGFSNEQNIFCSHSLDELANSKVLLLHRRLSIIDLSDAGWQPMVAHNNSCAVVFNGEIYNYQEIKEELSRDGVNWRSHSDTEVLLVAYEKWGRTNINYFLNKLVGMFAFCILDKVTNEFVLARDYFGIKPLYYILDQNRFAFASEIKALLPLLNYRKANLQRVYDYLNYGLTDHGTDTMFADIYQLPAAHFLRVPLDRFTQLKCDRYWSLNLSKPLQISYTDATSQLQSLFLENIQLHLRSDVRTGACLSGGIDSSAIVSSIRYLYPQSEIHTFSYIADDPLLSEEKWVDLVCQSASTSAHKVYASLSDLIEDLEDLLTTQDEPFGSTSIYAQYRVFKLANANGIKVMLDGQGADELFAGYRPSLLIRLRSLLSQGKWLDALQFSNNIRTLPDVKLMSFIIQKVIPYRLRSLFRNIPTSGANTKFFSDRDIQLSVLSRGVSKSLLIDSLYQTLTETSVPMLLRYEDRNSMRFSIESRVPFLTPTLAEFMLNLPEEYIISKDGTSKAIFRQAMRGIVPDATLDRKDKIGFATPEKKWLILLKPWLDKTLSSDTARSIPVLDLPAIHHDWQMMVKNKSPFNFRIWRWANLIKWTELYSVEYS